MLQKYKISIPKITFEDTAKKGDPGRVTQIVAYE